MTPEEHARGRVLLSLPRRNPDFQRAIAICRSASFASHTFATGPVRRSGPDLPGLAPDPPAITVWPGPSKCQATPLLEVSPNLGTRIQVLLASGPCPDKLKELPREAAPSGALSTGRRRVSSKSRLF